MSTAQMIRASEISVKTGEPINSILVLHFDKRMSWSKVTKNLKVSESDIRKAIASVSRERKVLVRAAADANQ